MPVWICRRIWASCNAKHSASKVRAAIAPEQMAQRLVKRLQHAPSRGVEKHTSFIPWHRGAGALSLRPMKLFALIPLIILVLFQAGCALPPTSEEQAREATQRDQVEKRSDAFAKQLQQ